MRLGRIDTRLAAALASGDLTGVTSPQARQEIAEDARHRAATRTGRAAAASHRTVPAAPIPAAA